MITKYQANIENDIMIGKRSVDAVDVFYIALSHTAINENGTGLTEPNDKNYKRLRVENNSSEFTKSTDGITKNLNQWEFEISTKVWESAITHWAITDKAIGGNVLYYDSLSANMNVDVNQVVMFNPLAIQIKRSGL